MRASTLFAVTSSCTANTGTSQNASALSDSYTGLGFTGEYQGGTDAMSPRSYTISKNMVFKAALCRVRYLFWAMAVQSARTWGTLSGTLSQSLHVTTPVNPSSEKHKALLAGAAHKAQTYPPLYVSGSFAIRLATRNILHNYYYYYY